MVKETSLDTTKSIEPYSPPRKILKHIMGVPQLKSWIEDPVINHMQQRIQLISKRVSYIVEYIEYVTKNLCRKWNLNRVDTPSMHLPDVLRGYKDFSYIWDIIEDHSVGRYYTWMTPAQDCREEFIRQNKNYRRNIIKWEDEIDLESDVLQKIVETNPRNVRNLKFIEYKTNNVKEFLEKHYWGKVEFVEDIFYIFRKLFWFCFMYQM
jgi:hypothetical protein